MSKRYRRRIIAASTVALIVALPAVATAHETRQVGDHEVVVGWSNEPAFAGFGNEVQVVISHGRQPVEEAELEAVVAFGEEDSDVTTDPIPLEPAFDSPGEYLGYIIPTRPGTYSFHVTGTVEGEEFDETFTSGPDTFSDIENPTAVEFPEQDPTRGEIAGAVDQITGRIDVLRAEVAAAAEEANDPDPLTMWIAIGAGVVAVIALVVALIRRRSAV
jgi:hypothetical protein